MAGLGIQHLRDSGTGCAVSTASGGGSQISLIGVVGVVGAYKFHPWATMVTAHRPFNELFIRATGCTGRGPDFDKCESGNVELGYRYS